MKVLEQVQVELASVEVGDEYQVEVRVYRKRMDLTPAQAVAFADALMVAAGRAKDYELEQIAELKARLSGKSEVF